MASSVCVAMVFVWAQLDARAIVLVTTSRDLLYLGRIRNLRSLHSLILFCDDFSGTHLRCILVLVICFTSILRS